MHGESLALGSEVGDRCIEGGEEFAQNVLAGLAVMGAHCNGLGGVIRLVGVVIGVIPAIEQARPSASSPIRLHLIHQAKRTQLEGTGCVTRGRMRGCIWSHSSQSAGLEPCSRSWAATAAVDVGSVRLSGVTPTTSNARRRMSPCIVPSVRAVPIHVHVPSAPTKTALRSMAP